MSDQPSTVNSTVQGTDEIIKGLIYNVAVEAAITYMQAQFPFLNYPLISSLFKYAVKYFGNLIFSQFAQAVAFQVIDFQTEAEQIEYQSAVSALQAANTKGDQDAINKAKEDLKKKLGSLIHYDGS